MGGQAFCLASNIFYLTQYLQQSDDIGTIITDILQMRKGDTGRLYNFLKIIQQKSVGLE